MAFLSLYLFAAVCLLLMLGFPVAFTLAGTALAFAAGGVLFGVFDAGFLSALPGRIFGTVNNTTLIAVPLFILMGTVLERSPFPWWWSACFSPPAPVSSARPW